MKSLVRLILPTENVFIIINVGGFLTNKSDVKFQGKVTKFKAL